jgi:CBS domain containing-hemolysin-like protein
LISRVLELQNRTVGQVARPLDLVDSVLVTTPVSEVLQRCHASGHTRLPVWSGEGRSRRIVGVVSLKNLLYRDVVPPETKAGDLLKPALFLKESVRLEVALRRLQRSGQPLAIVVDRDGRERGLVSLTDILRVVFGEVNV